MRRKLPMYFLFNRLVAVNAPALTKAGASCTCYAHYHYLISSSGIIIAAIALKNLLSIIKNTSLYFLFNRLVAVNAPALTKAGASCTCYAHYHYLISSSGIITAAIALKIHGNTMAEIIDAKSTADVCILSINSKS